MGSAVSISFTNGAAYGVNLLAVKDGAQTLTASAGGFSCLTNLSLTVAHGVYSPAASYFDALNTSGSIRDPFPVMTYLRDAYGNNIVSNLPTFVFVRADNGGVTKDYLLKPISSNFFSNWISVESGPGHYLFSSYFDIITETQRIKRDTQSTNDGWIRFDLYRAVVSNVENLLNMDANKNGLVLTQNPVKKSENVEVFFRGVAGQNVQIAVFNLSGDMVKLFPDIDIKSDGLQYFSWTPKTSSGTDLDPGIYFILLKSKNPDTKKYFKMMIVK
jgi:hypothetical protein